ncbi:hypothetical protein ACQP2F_14485 [Actinoplanes sp. CA-030573]|uniref:hypothetical protein n=1 Tax=Actinoplanes sp. CA-030573 TaxID=3239898 RepID=UPI003D8A8AE7
MGKHRAPEPPRPLHRRLAKHAMHPLAHLAGLIALHCAALLLRDKTPLLSLLLLH